MNGTTTKNTNRTYFLYFDSLANSPPLKPIRDYGFSPSSPNYTPRNTQNLKFGEFFRIADISAYTGRRLNQRHYGDVNNPFDDVYGYPYIEELVDYEGKVARVRDRSGRQAHSGYDQRYNMDFYWAHGSQENFQILKIAARIDDPNTRTGLYLLTEDGWRVVMFTPNAEWTQGGYFVDHTWGVTLVPDGKWRIYEYDLRHLANTYYADQLEWYQERGAPNQYDFWFDNVIAYKESGALLEANRSYSIPESHVYTPETKRANIVVRTIDIHGNLIPNVNITMYNKSTIIKTDFANVNGTVSFTNLSHADYNFTVTITSDIGDHKRIVNTTSTAIIIDKVYQEINLTCEMSKNTFNIIDVDGKPLESGWIIVGNSTGDTQIQNSTIDSSGEAIFRWLNVTPYQYNYTIFYQDKNYNPSTIWLAKGDITTRNSIIQVGVNMTTVNFTVYADNFMGEIMPGAKLNISTQNNPRNVVNLTTDENGMATLRWLNSSSVGILGNYTVRIDFYGPRDFSVTGGAWPPDENELSFNVTSQNAYILQVQLSLEDFQTKILSLNPNDNIEILWESRLKIRALLNVTKAGGDASYLGPTYADNMEYKIYDGLLLVGSGTMPIDQDYEGTHYRIIDTNELETDVNYLISISAYKSGYLIPSDLYLTLNILNHELELNQSQNDDSAKTDYWGHNVDMSVKPYGKYTESFSINVDIFKDDNHNFEFSIPDVNNEWNLSKIVFNVSNIAFNVEAVDIEINITDPYNNKHTWTDDNGSYYYVNIGEPSGIFYDLAIDLNGKSPTKDDKFNFLIEGTFTGIVTVLAEAYFIRDVINVQYSRFNVSESISIFSDDNGWAIKNITFELKNCYNPSTWDLIDPKNIANLNITTNENITYFLDSGIVGEGKLTISDRLIYPLDNQFLFIIDKKTNIVFDVKIKIEYIQEFYKNQYFETLNLSKTVNDFINGGTFQLELVGGDWLDSGALLKIVDLNSSSGLVYPSDVVLRLIVGGFNLPIGDEQSVGEGSLSLDFLNKDIDYPASLTSNQSVTFSISLTVSYTKTYSYETTGSVSYLIREAPDVYGTVQYDEDLKNYQQTVDTSILNVGTYTIRFTISKDYYSSAVKDLSLIVLNRPTLINGSTDFIRSVEQSYAMEEKTFKISFNDSLTGTPLTNLDIQSYLWERYDDQGQINETGSGTLYYESGYYILNPITESFKLGEHLILVTFGKDNYDTKNAMISLTIVDRPTLINEMSQLETVQATRYAGFEYNFTFSYVDVLTNNDVINLSEQSYTWKRYDNQDQVIDSGQDTLRFNNNSRFYELDFDSVTREPGKYELSVILDKENYTIQSSLIVLNIIERPINYVLDATNLIVDLIKVVQGKDIVFSLELSDPTDNNNALTGASVTIRFGEINYANIEEIENGVYQLTVSTNDKEAFFTSLTLTGQITIEKEYYETVTILFTTTIGMTEIFPGVPMFYFLMILGSVLAIVGSLVAYRVIQQKRIPTFVKKARSMKKNIKGKKTISDSLLYPSKEQFIVKKFGDKWAKLGLSLGEILGIKGKVKKENLPEDQIKKVKLDKRKLEKEKLKKDKIEKKKLEKEKQEQERLEKEKLEQERLEKEKLEEKELPKEKGEDE